jgi:hypothetical protein
MSAGHRRGAASCPSSPVSAFPALPSPAAPAYVLQVDVAVAGVVVVDGVLEHAVDVRHSEPQRELAVAGMLQGLADVGVQHHKGHLDVVRPGGG